jgi:hypothetical protein
MNLSPFSEADSHSADEKIPPLPLWDLKIYCHVFKSPLQDPAPADLLT